MVTKHRPDLPVLCGCFPPAIYLTFGSVHMSVPCTIDLDVTSLLGAQMGHTGLKSLETVHLEPRSETGGLDLAHRGVLLKF